MAAVARHLGRGGDDDGRLIRILICIRCFRMGGPDFARCLTWTSYNPAPTSVPHPYAPENTV